MKEKYIIIPLILIILVISGYFAYNFFQGSSKYRQTFQSELNSSDYHAPGWQIKEIAETYISSSTFYHISIMQFADISSATNGINKLIEQYNPGMILLEKKYVNYKELSPGSYYYFYQSEKNIISIDLSGDKNNGDNFVIWYYSKYPNKVSG